MGCLVASQSPGDLDYRTLGQASTMFLGRFTQKQEISKIDQMIGNAPDPKAITANLPSLKAGEFELFSPDVSDEVVQMRVRWLLTPHGSPLTSESLRPLTPEPLRKWAAGFVRRAPKRARVPSWRRGEAAAPPELMHGIPTLRSADDPMQVMLTTTNALAFSTLPRGGAVEVAGQALPTRRLLELAWPLPPRGARSRGASSRPRAPRRPRRLPGPRHARPVPRDPP